jgi:hypothetical protein
MQTRISGLYVETLMTYASPSATKLFAAADHGHLGRIDDRRCDLEPDSLTNGRWACMRCSRMPSASYLACVNNSADGMRYYNGSGWSDRVAHRWHRATKLASTSASHMNRHLAVRG